MEIENKIAVITGAASGIARAVAAELAKEGATAVGMVDVNQAVGEAAQAINQETGREVAVPFTGDVTDGEFRHRVFESMTRDHGLVNICVPAAGITRDALAVKVDKETGKATIYDIDTFRLVTEINLIAPIYWALEMVAWIAEDRAVRGLRKWQPDERVQGTVIFIGSVSSQGNKGQISYATTKAGLEGAAATLTMEAIFHGVRCGVIHPGYTDTPMVRALGEDFIKEHILPKTQLNRLIRPEEIANAICAMISNSAISGEVWADAGWSPGP
ncbi:MAG: SDR family oxidoreductase [Gammaproteobacteria bacterium]|jgi:3-oxoacyl-[acyl-carrier protein] reductase